MVFEFMFSASVCQSGEILMELIKKLVQLGPDLQNTCAPVASRRKANKIRII
jgi:hypothetical protein